MVLVESLLLVTDRQKTADRIIEGADAATFRIREGLCDVCAEDKNGCDRYEEWVDCESLK